MNSEQLIKNLIKQGESEQLEFKEVVRKDIIGKVVCSFLNNIGGQVIIGVSDDKSIVGVKNAENIKNELEDYLNQEIVPTTPIMVSAELVGKNEVLVIKVWAGSKQPYVFNGGIYYRRGVQTQKATSNEISELIHNRQDSELHWERKIAFGVEEKDIDFDEVQKTIELALDTKKLSVSFNKPLDFLSYLGLYQDGNFTNAAVILFAKKPSRFIPQARVRAAFLEKGKIGDTFIDDQVMEGNIFKNIELIQVFLKKHLPFVRKFDDTNWKREDDYIFPMSALREGIMNALVHRSYSDYSDSISIIIYADKLEIINSGKSPLKASELRRSHLSMPVNPDIAHITFLRGYIEKIGRGTLKIIDSCKKAGLESPKWETKENQVKLSFYGKVRNEGAIEGAVKGAIDVEVEGAIEGAIEGATKNVKNKLKSLLKEIARNEGKRVPEYIEVINVSESTIERYLKQLRDANLIEFKGDAAQTGGYYLTEAIKKKLK